MRLRNGRICPRFPTFPSRERRSPKPDSLLALEHSPETGSTLIQIAFSDKDALVVICRGHGYLSVALN
jgi:hypothetical protein